MAKKKTETSADDMTPVMLPVEVAVSAAQGLNLRAAPSMDAAVLAVRILALADTEIKLRYDAWRALLGEKIVKANESLRDVAYEFKTN